jgi:transposase
VKTSTILIKKGIAPGRVVAAYRLHRSTRKVAAILGISASQVGEAVRGYDPALLNAVGGSSFKGKPKPKRLHGKFAQWIKANPKVKFPQDLGEIAAMSGCSKNTIKCFLYRLRKQGKAIPLLDPKKRKHQETLKKNAQRKSLRMGAEIKA